MTYVAVVRIKGDSLIAVGYCCVVPALQSANQRLLPRGGTELPARVGELQGDGSRGDAELPRDLLVVEPSAQPLEAFDLPRDEDVAAATGRHSQRRPLPRPAGRSVAGHFQRLRGARDGTGLLGPMGVTGTRPGLRGPMGVTDIGPFGVPLKPPGIG
jgi:hypothetical protein